MTTLLLFAIAAAAMLIVAAADPASIGENAAGDLVVTSQADRELERIMTLRLPARALFC